MCVYVEGREVNIHEKRVDCGRRPYIHSICCSFHWVRFIFLHSIGT